MKILAVLIPTSQATLPTIQALRVVEEEQLWSMVSLRLCT